jgi:hypothetical protein
MWSPNKQKLLKFANFFTKKVFNLISTQALFMKKQHFVWFGLFKEHNPQAKHFLLDILPRCHKKLQFIWFSQLWDN